MPESKSDRDLAVVVSQLWLAMDLADRGKLAQISVEANELAIQLWRLTYHLNPELMALHGEERSMQIRPVGHVTPMGRSGR